MYCFYNMEIRLPHHMEADIRPIVRLHNRAASSEWRLSVKRRVVPVPAETSMVGLINASELRWHIANHPIWGTMTDIELAKRFRVSAGFIGMVRSGSRQPSKKFLKAAGFEAVTLYRMKSVSRRIGNPDGQ